MTKKIEFLEDCKIRLALLKENFEYWDTFEKFLKEENNPEFEDIEFTFDDLTYLGVGVFNRYFNQNPFIYNSHHIYNKIKDLINPQIETDLLLEDFLEKILPRLFYEQSVSLVYRDEWRNYAKELHFDGAVRIPINAINENGLGPWERLYKIDLRKGKTETLKDLEKYLDRAIQNNKRIRLETWKHLKVWRLRRQRKSFSEIGRALKMSADKAKKSFYRAYELTQGKKYEPDFLKREIWVVKKTEIKITCETCPKRNTCRDLCPDVLRYVNQDHSKLIEEEIKDDSDSYKEYLLHKNSY